MKQFRSNIISLCVKTQAVIGLMTLVGLLGLSQLVMAQDPVYFADANLKARVESELGISDPTPTDMLSLTILHAEYSEITNLTGIEYATNLARLYLRYNQISDISSLSGLTSLTFLDLGGNEISDFSSLSGLANLTLLSLTSNQISDISTLSGLINLSRLYLYNNQISDITALSGLTSLTYLDLISNQISDISALSGLANLTGLDLPRNQISDISALSGLTSLLYLNLMSNPLTIEAYCIYLPLIESNNPGISLNPNPYPPEDCLDGDGDGVIAGHDNCPETSNPMQEDTYPPQGNNIGDACDCESDFNCDGNVDTTDVTSFLTDFGRNTFFNPCTNPDPCNGDVDCNTAVDAFDVKKFLEDFGRTQFNNPCPACVAGDWCTYQSIYLIDDIAGDGGKNFPTPQSITLNMGSTTCVDIFLSNVDEPQFAGGAWLDFTGSTADISYVSGGRCQLGGAEGCTGPWQDNTGFFANEPLGPGTVLYTVANLAGADPDVDGDLIVGQICLRHDSTNDATIDITTIPAFSTWTPINDEDVIPGSFVIQQ